MKILSTFGTIIFKIKILLTIFRIKIYVCVCVYTCLLKCPKSIWHTPVGELYIFFSFVFLIFLSLVINSKILKYSIFLIQFWSFFFISRWLIVFWWNILFVCLFAVINEKHQYFKVRLDLESYFSKLRLHSLLGRSNVALQIEYTCTLSLIRN